MNRSLRCGATVIQATSEHTILLTAAHCLRLDEGQELQAVCGDPHRQNSSLVQGVSLSVREGSVNY